MNKGKKSKTYPTKRDQPLIDNNSKTNYDRGFSSLKTEEEWLTTKEAATYLKISVETLWNLSSNGQVPYHKFGRRNRYALADLRRLLLSQKRGGFYGNKV